MGVGVRKRGGVRVGMLAAASALTMVTAAGMAWADEARVWPFKIEAQPLSSALIVLSEQADATIVAAPQLMRGKQAPAISGEFSLDEALSRLLEGSGLDYELAPGNRLILRPTGAVQDSAIRDGAHQLAQVAYGDRQAATAEATARPGAREAAGSGTVTGVVTDQRTGANLKGALVEIVETGQTAVTDDLGRFRFPSVRAGGYTLRISYLGFADSLTRITVVGGRDLRRDFALRGGTEMEELVVYGTRSARALALNRERTSENVSTVLSADLLGNFTGTTISDALRRAPGVAFVPDRLTGDGTNIIVRGLAPDFNTVTLNGIELPEGSGEGRSASLNNILADTVESITIHKTLLPNQDSSGVGGLIEIETKSPLDRPRRYANVVVEGARRAKDFSDDLLVSGTLSGTFGAEDRFGLSASVQYRDRSGLSFGYGHGLLFGQHLPLEADGSPSIRSRRDVDPRIPFPFEPSADDVFVSNYSLSRGDVATQNLAVTASAEWQIAEHTNIRFDYQRSEADQGVTTQGFSFAGVISYAEQPVPSLGGEVRRALTWTGGIRSATSYGENSQEDVTSVFTFRGDSRFDDWDVRYSAGHTRGEQERTQRGFSTRSTLSTLDSSFVLPEATDPVEGRIITLFGPRRGTGVQLPLLTDAGFDLINSESTYVLNSANDNRGGFGGRNDRYTGQMSVRRSFDNKHVRYLEVGLSYEASRFEDFPLGEEGGVVVIGTGSADIAPLGLSLSDVDLSAIGVDNRFRAISLADSRRFVQDIPSLLGRDGLFGGSFPRDPRLRDTFTDEDELAGYVQSQIVFGDVEFIGGVRVTRVKVDAVNLTGPRIFDENNVEDVAFRETFSTLVSQSATQTDVLPRIVANYRPSRDLVFRAGYFLTVTRPQIEFLSDNQIVTLSLAPGGGPNDNQPELSVSQGNPDLRPSKTHNIDFSAEYYSDQIGVIKVGAFYKRISDFIQNNSEAATNSLEGVPLPDDPRFTNLPDNIFIEVRQATNDDNIAHIWGIETAIERQLTFLPGLWSGFGVFVNYVYSDSSKTVPVNWSAPVFDAGGNLITRERATVEFSGVPFDQQPKHSGTAALTYNKYGLDVTLAYSYQSRRSGTIRGNQLSSITESVDTLDIKIEYRFDLGPAAFRVYFEGADLLKGTDDRTFTGGDGLLGKTLTVAGGNFNGGREFRLGLATAF